MASEHEGPTASVVKAVPVHVAKKKDRNGVGFFRQMGTRLRACYSGTAVEALPKHVGEERDRHIMEFFKRTGMRPQACYRLILLSMSLRIIGGTWIAMVFLEYTRFYVINDMNTLSTMETATESPLSFLKAIMFPYWGVIADRVSRKKVLVLASVASCVSAWMMSFMPSMATFVISRCLSLVADINGPIRSAVLRDLFSPAEWEHVGGGVTGIKSHMATIGAIVAAVAVGTGMGLLRLGDMGWISLENEYSKRKGDCQGQRHCVTPGSYSWDSDEWQVDGLLRLLMMMGAMAYTLEALLILFYLPETLKQEGDAGFHLKSICGFVKESWRDLGGPWNNLRVFATKQLRGLALIRVIHYALGSGGSAFFFSWYRRHQLDTLSMYTLGVSGGAAAFIVLLLVVPLVNRFGDLRGVWIPSNVFAMFYGVSVAMIPASHLWLSFVAFPLFGGPAAALGGFAPELLAKLVPGSVQGTFQTSKAFLFDFQRAVLVWPWLGLLICSENFAYPFDALPIWVALSLGVVALVLTLKQLPSDPKDAILSGKALDDFWETSYAKGKWYKKHGGHLPNEPPLCHEDAPDMDDIDDAKLPTACACNGTPAFVHPLGGNPMEEDGRFQ